MIEGANAQSIKPDDILYSGLKGDVEQGLKTLETIHNQGILKNKKIIIFKERFDRKSFEYEPEKQLSKKANQVYQAYQRYWWHGVKKKDSIDKLEQTLYHEIANILNVSKDEVEDDIETVVTKFFKSENLNVLSGRTGQFLELMIWNTEKELQHNIQLLGSHQKVSVVYLRDFPSFGWSYYATAGRASTGGWAKERLYLVADRYDLASINFKISYLKHEAQHYRDYQEFPWLQSSDLEFRAKLTELAFSTDKHLQFLMEKLFINNRVKANDPHGTANYYVKKLIEHKTGLKNLRYLKITEMVGRKIRAAAIEIFHWNTELLKEMREKDQQISLIAEGVDSSWGGD